MKLSGKVAVITGAARGIGRAIAVRFAREGALVALIDTASTEETQEAVAREGSSAIPLCVDITIPAAVEAAMSRVAEAAGGIDILVNNAGIIVRGTVESLTYEEWRRVIDVNVSGTFTCCKSVIPYMAGRGGGRILNVTSIAGKMGDITAAPAYGTSKGAVNTLTRSLARQLADRHITVNAIAPHAVETDMSAEWSDEQRRAIIDSIPLHRLAQPYEVAAAAVFLVSDEASFITGEVLNLNGGALMD